MNLFIIYIGGKHRNSLVEVHDIRFVVANTIEETYTELKNTWWGSPDSLHLDCWGTLKHIDGYDIHLKKAPAQQTHKLYFANVGGYDALQFTELHKNFCIVATNASEAKEKAKNQISHWESPHKDYLYTVEEVYNVQDAIIGQGLNIHLEPTQNFTPFDFTCRYVPIGI